MVRKSRNTGNLLRTTRHDPLLERFHRTLVAEIRATRPEYLSASFTVAEIYQDLVSYRRHRDTLGVEMNGDYENTLLRLLGGEGGFLVLESEPALREIQNELLSSNPNTGLFRQFAAAEVRLNPTKLDAEGESPGSGSGRGEAEGKGGRGAEARGGPPEAPREGDGPSDIPRGAEAREGAGGNPAPPANQKAEQPPTRGESETPAVGEERHASSPTSKETPVLPLHPAGSTSSGSPPSVSRPELSAPPSSPLPAQCPQCRVILPARSGLRFCPGCGTDVAPLACSSCGEKLEPGWRYCVACGTRAVP